MQCGLVARFDAVQSLLTVSLSASVADLLRNIVSQTVHLSTHAAHAPLLKQLLDLAVEGLRPLLGTKSLSAAFELST